MRPKIKLMADYDCWPLWGLSAVGNIDPDTLSLSEATKEALAKWAQDYNETLNRADPIQSGFKNSEEALAFNIEGWRLWKCLQSELPEFKVLYFDNNLGRVFYERPVEIS
ncbi:hypothetical protein EB810_06020 [Altererythrobacter sp. FM1]|nr:hypothetical protein EB810_06020 [Altererythrobacter sp. FM1]